MQNPFRHRMPGRYYLLKNSFHQYMRRFRVRQTDNGSLQRFFSGDDTDCLLVYEQECASRQYRLDHAGLCFDSFGLTCMTLSVFDLDRLKHFDFVQSKRFVLLHRLPMTPSLHSLLHACQRYSIPVILDLDDAIHDYSIYRHSAVFDLLTHPEKHLHRQMTQRISRTLSHCDAVTVSTRTLSGYLSDTGKPVTVVPNRVSPAMFDYAGTCTRGDPVQQIGYLCGSETHNRDFRSICDAVYDVLAAFPDARLVIAGPLDIPEKLRAAYPERIIRKPFLSWPAYLSTYSDIRIHLAPLEPENPFCMAKSGVKYLEAAISSVPSVAYPTDDFRRLIRHGETGYLASTRSDWTEIICHCLSDPAHAFTIGRAARDSIAQQETVSQNREIWATCLNRLGIRV